MIEFSSITEANRFGLQFERLRLQAASYNIAAANVATANPAESFLWQVVAVEKADGTYAAELQQVAASTKIIKDTSHPMANAQGLVFFPKVDPTHEMASLVSATRAYEANVRAYNAKGDLTAAALEIGAN